MSHRGALPELKIAVFEGSRRSNDVIDDVIDELGPLLGLGRAS